MLVRYLYLVFCGGHISRRTVNCGSLVARRFTLPLQQSIKCHFSNNDAELEVVCAVCRRVSSKRRVEKLNPTLQTEATAKYVLLEEFVCRV